MPERKTQLPEQVDLHEQGGLTPQLTEGVKVSKREFLKLAALVGAGGLLAACGIEPRKKPETIPVDIPGVSVERHYVTFEDITGQVPGSFKEDLLEVMEQRRIDPYSTRAAVIFNDQIYPSLSLFPSDARIYDQCGSSIIAYGRKEPEGSINGTIFYFSETTGQFYSLDIKTPADMPYDDQGLWSLKIRPDVLNEEDRKLWGLKNTKLNIGEALLFDVSCNGRILYRIGFPRIRARIIADIPNGTKTVLRYELKNEHDFVDTQMSDDGKTLLIAFYPRSVYLIDLDTWRVRYEADLRNYDHELFLSGDGGLLYIENDTRPFVPENKKAGYLHNATTGDVSHIWWPEEVLETSFWTINASSNLQFIAREFRDDAKESEGIVVKTPSGLFKIEMNQLGANYFNTDLRKETFLPPFVIKDDGTIYTRMGDYFKFEGDTYKWYPKHDSDQIFRTISIEKLDE